MTKILFIGLGGAIGTIARYVMSGIDYKFSGGVFPVSTMVINVLGSGMIGFLWGMCEAVAIPSNVRIFVFVGILGGFTTFSTFALESFSLMRDGERSIAIANIILSNVLGVGVVFIGYGLARLVLNFYK